MASKQLLKVREKFICPVKDVINWYPGHMNKGMKQMQNKLKTVDCILEVHDARIPFSGRNYNFYNLLTAIKPHILILNKMDLSDLSYKPQLLEKLRTKNTNKIVFTNCKNDRDMGIKELTSEIVSSVEEYNAEHKMKKSYYTVMVIGIPNVGKSSIINVLRSRNLKKEKATRVGATPGVTRSVLEKIKINEEPLIYLLDTPGIMIPSIRNMEVALRLALCDTIKEGLMEYEIIADYLLFCLNKQQNFSYVEYLGLEEPCDDIRIVLLKAAINLNKFFLFKSHDGTKKLKPDLGETAKYFIRAFRDGQFGKLLLDEDLLRKYSNNK